MRRKPRAAIFRAFNRLLEEKHFKLEILCIMGWVGIWEATEIFLTERPELIMMKKNLANMQNAEIVITYLESE